MEKWSAWVDGREISYQNDRPYPYWVDGREISYQNDRPYPYWLLLPLAVLAGSLVGLLAWWIWR